MSTSLILLASGIYFGVLFATAYFIDKRGRSAIGPQADGWIYALSVAAYCTSWTFYGSVGRSANTGFGFLPIYIGPALVFIFAQPFLQKLLAVSKAQHITSIADLIAARYGKHQSLAGLVTLIAVIGVVPYISLQLKAVSSTFILLSDATGSAGDVPLFADTALYVALIMCVFVIVFGTRRIDATEQHRGLMAAVALERRRFRLKEYIHETLDSLRPRIKRTEHVIHVDCPDDLELHSYPGAFSQILTNLVINSLQHGFENVQAGQIEIAARPNGRELSLEYSDNGSGMSEINAKRIFEPFFTTRRGQGGSGLGMHVVYNLVTQTLNGRIECRTATGAGMRIHILMPLDQGNVDG